MNLQLRRQGPPDLLNFAHAALPTREPGPLRGTGDAGRLPAALPAAVPRCKWRHRFGADPDRRVDPGGGGRIPGNRRGTAAAAGPFAGGGRPGPAVLGVTKVKNQAFRKTAYFLLFSFAIFLYFRTPKF